MVNEKKEAKPARYIIHVKNHLDFLWENWFEGVTITHKEDGMTILSVETVDQSALHGLLDQIRDLNLTLLLVRKADDQDGNDQADVVQG